MQIHVIAFDIPYPADYGGVIDVYYKIKALKEMGFQVILHCFQYGKRKQSEKLNEITQHVYYYKRSNSAISLISLTPFIVKTRRSRKLLDNLCADQNPILFEGIHSTFWINHVKLEGRAKFVRMHNIEWQYYTNLATHENNIFRKIYLKLESAKLKRYESALLQLTDITILPISRFDFSYFIRNGAQKVLILPAFHPFDRVYSKPGRGKYVLFHGNLGVADNHDVAVFLIEKVFPDLQMPLVVAGKNPRKRLLNKAASVKNKVEIVANPDDFTMKQLLNEAHVHVIWSNQSEGVKIKLYYAVYDGRFVIANSAVLKNSDLKQFVERADTVPELKKAIGKCFTESFEQQLIEERRDFLNNSRAVQKETIQRIFNI